MAQLTFCQCGGNIKSGANGTGRAQKRHHRHPPQQQQQQQQQEGGQPLELDADTIVIGNGPAGIALSALLSGWQPFYNKSVPHPDPHLHAELKRMASRDDGNDADGLSLFDQDLGTLADQHFARSESAGGSGGHTPFSVLYDCLARPHLTTPSAYRNDADQPLLVGDGTTADDGTGRHRSPSPCASSSAASCLCWRRRESDAVPHIVLGDQHIGGSWTEYDDDMLTVSAAEWMDLPGFSLAADFVGNALLAQQRPRAGLYKAYLNAYVDAMGLRHNFRPFTRVTRIEKICHPSFSDECHWLLRGTETVQKTSEQRTFMLRCRHVVLACGRQQPKLLGVPGESAAAADGRVVYSLSSLKQQLEKTACREPATEAPTATMGPTKMEPATVQPATMAWATVEQATEAATATMARTTVAAVTDEVSGDCPVVVIGDGISAADAVLHCLSIEQPVLHIVRRTERELRNIQLSRLSSSVYPEYARVYRLMSGRTREVNYRRLLGTSVHSILGTGTPGGVLLLASNDKQQHQDGHSQLLRQQCFRTLAICIGRRLELPLLKEYLHSRVGEHDDDDDLATEFNTRYQSITDPSLFAIGAMAGDHFVRFLVGGTLCVAQKLHQQRQKFLLQGSICRSFFDIFAALVNESAKILDFDIENEHGKNMGYDADNKNANKFDYDGTDESAAIIRRISAHSAVVHLAIEPATTSPIGKALGLLRFLTMATPLLINAILCRRTPPADGLSSGQKHGEATSSTAGDDGTLSDDVPLSL